MMNVLPWIFSGLIGVVPPLVQWVALFLTRRQRTGGWWVMLVGTTIQILGKLASSVVMALITTASRAGTSLNTLANYNMIVGSVATVGGVVFTIGFVIYLLTRRAALERQQQLEAMTAAMAEELRVLRERVR